MDLHPDEHLDPSAEITLEQVQHRAVKGVVALVGRFGIIYIIAAIAQGLLGIYLTQTEWGVFAVVSAVVNFLVYFSDIGLAAALIQNKDKLEDSDLKTTFTTQQLLVLTLLFFLFLIGDSVKSTFNLSVDGMFLLYALGASFFLSSLKTIPSVLLERKIQFEKLAFAQILENIVYYVILVYFAWQGAGTKSFAFAVLARGIVGLVTLYILQPWMPGIAFSKKSFKKLLGFGVPYQLNTFIAVAKDDGITIFLGKILGLEMMGLLNWAQKWAQMPLRIFLDSVTKVTFPAFSRIQDRKAELERAVTSSLFFISFLVFPSVLILVLTSPMIVAIVPRYEKWIPALLPLAIVSVNTMFASVTTQLTNLLNAIGKIKITMKLLIMWSVLSWAFIPLLAQHYGLVGASVGYALVGSSSIVAIWIVKRLVNFSIWDGFGKTLLASLLMAVFMLVFRPFLPYNLAGLGVITMIGGSVYLILVFVLVGPKLFADVRKIAKAFMEK